MKRIATTLRPPTLDHLGLAEAIHWESLTFKARTGLRCTVRTNKTHSALTAEQQTALFRIFQEALTNIVRHAQASSVHVTLTEQADRFEMSIRDNGRGITEAQTSDPSAIGLLGMRERTALMGGIFRISGRRGKGTVVSIEVPVAILPRGGPGRAQNQSGLMIRILLVDDHPVARQGIRTVLTDRVKDAVVGEAADAASALKQVRSQRMGSDDCGHLAAGHERPRADQRGAADPSDVCRRSS